MRKIILLAGLLACSGAWAETRERGAICYILDENGNGYDKTSCAVTNKQSGDYDSVSYKIRNNSFTLSIYGGDGEYSAVKNGKHYKGIWVDTYVRDKNFKKTDDWNNYAYYCYKSKIIHFCEK